jgi:hypothetical protein
MRTLRILATLLTAAMFLGAAVPALAAEEQRGTTASPSVSTAPKSSLESAKPVKHTRKHAKRRARGGRSAPATQKQSSQPLPALSWS